MSPLDLKLQAASTFLFVPATRPGRIAKALDCGADVVIVDLEDAVSVNDKAAARSILRDWLDSAGARPVVVRVNGRDTAWHDADMTLCCHRHVAGVMLPKAEDASTLTQVATACGKPVLPIIESALALQHLQSIASATGCARLVFGKLDLAVDLGLQASTDDPDEVMFAPYRALLVLASRLSGLPAPIDGVFVALDDNARLEAYARRARRDGFGALLLIHPHQVNPVASALKPSAVELAWARRVLDASAASGGAATRVDGQMIDAPVVRRAERLLEKVGACQTGLA